MQILSGSFFFFSDLFSILWYLMCEVFKIHEKLPLPLLSDLLPQSLLYFCGVCYFFFCQLKLQWILVPVAESLVS